MNIVRTALLAVTVCLAACAAPTPEQKIARLDELYGPMCGKQQPASASDSNYRACTLAAYKAKREQAIETYNADAGRSAVDLLLLVH
jgi:hypothetical protein